MAEQRRRWYSILYEVMERPLEIDRVTT